MKFTPAIAAALLALFVAAAPVAAAPVKDVKVATPTAEQQAVLEKQRLDYLAAQDSMAWTSTLITLVPLLIIAAIFLVPAFYKMRNDTKIAQQWLDTTGDNKLIMERQRLMLEHLSNIEKILTEILRAQGR